MNHSREGDSRQFEELVVRWTEPRTGLIVVHVAGELDLATAGQLERQLWEVPPAAAVIVDLSEVRFLAVAGIAVLLRAAGRAREQRRGFAVVVVRHNVTRVLRLTGADREMKVVTTVSDAVRELRVPRPRVSPEYTVVSSRPGGSAKAAAGTTSDTRSWWVPGAR
jgi:anti-sigma B factor antagonist